MGAPYPRVTAASRGVRVHAGTTRGVSADCPHGIRHPGLPYRDLLGESAGAEHNYQLDQLLRLETPMPEAVIVSATRSPIGRAMKGP